MTWSVPMVPFFAIVKIIQTRESPLSKRNGAPELGKQPYSYAEKDKVNWRLHVSRSQFKSVNVSFLLAY
jgi:hypothetical protein